MQIGDALRQAAQSIQNRLGLALLEASFEANLLCQQVLNVNRAWLISHESDALEANQQDGFEALLQRRLNGEPMAYILGSRDFYGLQLKTTPATLIPRPDTETLVEAALAKIPQNASLNILDLGTGTGAVDTWVDCKDRANFACKSGYDVIDKVDTPVGAKRELTFQCKK